MRQRVNVNRRRDLLSDAVYRFDSQVATWTRLAAWRELRVWLEVRLGVDPKLTDLDEPLERTRT